MCLFSKHTTPCMCLDWHGGTDTARPVPLAQSRKGDPAPDNQWDLSSRAGGVKAWREAGSTEEEGRCGGLSGKQGLTGEGTGSNGGSVMQAEGTGCAKALRLPG